MATDPQDNMMRIAIAGSGGLARIFANYLNATVHPFIILSRQVRLPGEVQSYRGNGTNWFVRPNLTWKLLAIRSLL
jgi:hypothetical protein